MIVCSAGKLLEGYHHNVRVQLANKERKTPRNDCSNVNKKELIDR